METHEKPGLDLPLAPTLEPLCSARSDEGFGDAIRNVIAKISAAGFRFVQLSATQRGLRPRDLDRSARRDILATLRRSELAIAGIDLFIPSAHFLDPSYADRAMDAVIQAIDLAADFGRCSVSLMLPANAKDADDVTKPIFEAIAAAADRCDVKIADFATPPVVRNSPMIGIGVDPAALLAQHLSPHEIVLANGPQIAAARICDLLTSGLRGPIGMRERQLDWEQYKIALSIITLQSPVVLDARQWTDPWTGIAHTARLWQR